MGMELLDSAGDWGRAWEVLRPNRKRTVMSAATLEVIGTALVFRAEEGTPLLVLGPGEWLEVQRSVGGLVPDGAQSYARG
jgi:hypothetical protein